MSSIQFDPPILATQVIAFTVIAVVVAMIFYWRGERRLSGMTRFALSQLRTATIVIIGILLFNPIIIKSMQGGEGRAKFFVLADVSRSMNVRDIGGSSRFDVARRSVFENNRLIRDLESVWNVSAYTFSSKFAATSMPRLRAIKRPDGDHTEIGDALIGLASQASRGKERTAGALLISDGRDNGSSSPVAAAKIARSAGIPIWTLCLGTATGSKDLAVLTYTNQSFAFAKQCTSIGADIQQKGYDAQTLTVTLERDGKPVSRQTVPMGRSGRQTVRFPVVEENPGLYTYSVSVAQMPEEINTRNNRRSVFLRVINDRIKVLVLDARPSWDTKFLSQSLRLDANIEFTSVYRLTDSRNFSVTTSPGKTRDSKIALPRRAEELFPYDIVVMGKGFEDLLTETGVDLLKKYLVERGGSVVFFRGRPDEGSEKLRDIEPVVWSSDEVRNMELSLTDEGRYNPAFAFPLSEEPQVILRKLPHLISATRVQGEKSLAVILAQGTMGEGLNEPMAAVAYQRYGAGRVMVIAGQGLWQWSFLPEELSKYDVIYKSFWAQMFRWLVSGSDFLPGRDVSVKTDRLSYVPGQRAHLLVYCRHAPDPKMRPNLTVIDPDNQRVAVTPGLSQSYGATYVAEYTPSKTGDYSVVLQTGTKESDRIETAFTVQESQQEDILTEADPQLMHQIAESSGGSPITTDQLRELPSRARNAERRALLREQTSSQWDKPWVFVLLCSLLGMEWYFRRRAGLC